MCLQNVASIGVQQPCKRSWRTLWCQGKEKCAECIFWVVETVFQPDLLDHNSQPHEPLFLTEGRREQTSDQENLWSFVEFSCVSLIAGNLCAKMITTTEIKAWFFRRKGLHYWIFFGQKFRMQFSWERQEELISALCLWSIQVAL